MREQSYGLLLNDSGVFARTFSNWNDVAICRRRSANHNSTLKACLLMVALSWKCVVMTTRRGGGTNG